MTEQTGTEGDATVTNVPVDETPDDGAGVTNVTPDETPDDADEMFPRKVVEDLRRENARYRDRAKLVDAYAQRLHTSLVAATGRLADPTDLPFVEDHLDDAEALTAAIDELLTRKPHLASRRPAGDVGQGSRGPAASQPFNLMKLINERA